MSQNNLNSEIAVTDTSVLVKQKNKRNTLADCLKGYACLLVLFGHVIMGVRKVGVDTPAFMELTESFIWTFHVALFMFLSGYVYKITGGWESKGTRSKFILHKLLNLGVPYLVFSVVYIIINSSISGVNTQQSITDIFWLWKDPVAQYWFLYALFNIFVVFTVLSGAMKNWQITLLLFLAGYLAPLFEVSFGSFTTTVVLGFSFGLGASVPSLIVDSYSVLKRLLLVVLHIVVVTLLITTGWSGATIIDEIEIILGIFGSVALISLIVKIKWIEKFLLFVNSHSFSIYVLHTIFTAGIRIVLNRVGIENYWLHIIAGTVVGLLAPTVASMIAHKTIYLDFVFYPSKTVKRLSSRKS